MFIGLSSLCTSTLQVKIFLRDTFLWCTDTLKVHEIQVAEIYWICIKSKWLPEQGVKFHSSSYRVKTSTNIGNQKKYSLTYISNILILNYSFKNHNIKYCKSFLVLARSIGVKQLDPNLFKIISKFSSNIFKKNSLSYVRCFVIIITRHQR